MISLGMTTVTISEARATLPALIDRVCNGDTVTITRHGEPVASIVEPVAQPVVKIADIHQFAEQLMVELHRPPGPVIRGVSDKGWADDLVAQIRADRDAE